MFFKTVLRALIMFAIMFCCVNGQCTSAAAQTMPFDLWLFENSDCTGCNVVIQCNGVGATDVSYYGTCGGHALSALVGTKYATKLVDPYGVAKMSWTANNNWNIWAGSLPASWNIHSGWVNCQGSA